MRLDKLLMQIGYGSKRDIRRLLFQQHVRIDGKIVMQENQNVDTAIHKIVVDNCLITHPTDTYFMLNKPKGVVSAVSDKNNTTVVSLILKNEKISGLYPVGRLDADTTGLLLITNNGQLGYNMLHPKYHVEKVYEVVLNGFIDDTVIASFEKGVIFLDGTVCQSAKLEIIEASPLESKARVTIKEGKFHQIKKMFLSVGVKVIALKRIQFGTLQLDVTLKEGEYRPLTLSELEQLKIYFR